MHSTLTPKTNALLVLFWAVITVVASVMSPVSIWLFILVWGLAGAGAGLLQLQALRRAPEKLAAAGDMFAVRRALMSSGWGKWYVYFFWFSQITLFGLAFYLLSGKAVFGLVTGYCSFAFMRELVSLPGTFALRKTAQ